jgi:WD40 repeat protein
MNLKGRGQRLYVVSLKDGSKKPIGEMTWMTILNVAWVADGSAVIANAAEDKAHALGLWYLPYPDGDPTRLTLDPSSYRGASLTADSGTLVSAREDLKAHLYIAREQDKQPPMDISPGLSNAYGRTGLAWTPDGKIIYDAGPAQHKSLWEIDPERAGEPGGRQLSDDNDIFPSVTPDSRYVVFASDRSGKLAIWEMDRSGSNPTILAEDGWKPSCRLENKWVVYQAVSDGRTRLWKVPIGGGGGPEALTGPDFDAENAAVSPDGKRVAFLLSNEVSSSSKPQIAIMDGDKLLSARYSLPDTVRQPIIRWRNDRTLLYIDEFARTADIWQQRLEGPSDRGAVDKPRRYLLPPSEFRCIFNFDWSGDGRIILSAGDIRSVEVDRVTLTKRSG